MKSPLKSQERDASIEELLTRLSGWTLRRNTFISGKFKCIYVGNPKVASSSVKWVLAEASVDPAECSKLRVHKRARRLLTLPPSDAVAAILNPEFTKFSIVRNPVDRLISAYRNKMSRQDFRAQVLRSLGESHDRKVPIEEFVDFVAQQEDEVRDPHWRSQFGLLRPDQISYTSVLKFENLELEWREFSRSIGLPESLPRLNSQKKPREGDKDVPVGLSRRIAEIYECDFRNFDYEMPWN